ncbi:hypothetical protein PRJ_3411 [Pseudomonas sp. XWY-1]|nr:hypothetical protein PRJ_3411 [Pseudomonas sp. XWY-1]
MERIPPPSNTRVRCSSFVPGP